ncbi:MAG TPA: hypothetical protein PLK28_20050 [Candidatus Rifleibacterium sp.]|nr:hypothetical protein [Candidatus Rifleibacterium sp.]
MNITNKISLTEEDLKELFALFTSCTKHEKQQIYDTSNSLCFKNENLNEEHSITNAKKEFAIDAWRAVIQFLHSRGYVLKKDGKEMPLGFVEDDFL